MAGETLLHDTGRLAVMKAMIEECLDQKEVYIQAVIGDLVTSQLVTAS